MDAAIGKYKVRLEENLLVLTHPAGISFDLSLEEAMELLDYLNFYRQTITASQRDTEPRLERVLPHKQVEHELK